MLIVFSSCKSEEDPLLIEYRNKAFHDIKIDSVKTFGFGLALPPRDSLDWSEENKKTAIYKKYGLYNKNLGCIVGDKKLEEATNEYRKITAIYLEKRNGKGWQKRLQTEADNIK